MTIFYDSLGTPSQLGAGLNNYSPDGAGWVTNVLPGGESNSASGTNWDGNPFNGDAAGSKRVPVASWMADITVHQGSLAVAWVEPQWTGSQLVMRGPFVKTWDGATWNSVGGEVDPAITPVALQSSPDPPGTTTGTRSAPARPWILSDGTDLFCVYTVREIALAPNTPPIPSKQPTGSCGCYYNVCDHTDFSKWKRARKVYVRKWNGASWVLWGEMPADSMNANIGGGGPSPHGVVEISACASPTEPGVVYVGMFERGYNTTAGYVPGAAEDGGNYLVDPGLSCFFGLQFGTFQYSGFYAGLKFGRFDGGAGTIKTLASSSSVDGPSASAWLPQQTSQTGWYQTFYVRNDTGAGYAFWGSSTGNISMTDFTTLTNQQTLAVTGSPLSIGWDSARGKYVVWTGFGAVQQVPDDASGPFEQIWNGTIDAADAVPSGDLRGPQLSLMLTDTGSGGELWFQTVGSHTLTNAVSYWGQFHVLCPSWDLHSYTSGDPDHAHSVGWPRPARIDDTLYAVSMWRNPADDTQDTAVRVYQATICRDCQHCGTNPPFLNNRIRVGTAATGGTGTTGPFVHAEIDSV